MTRITLITITVSVLAGLLFFACRPKEMTDPEMRSIVVLTRNVKKGETITADVVEILQGPNHQNHLYPIEKMELALGRKSRDDLVKGQALFPGFLDPTPPSYK